MLVNKQQPKVGLAFSGASSRSVFYIGFLEVLQENNYPIDYIAALSGATIVAASFASGTMNQLKEFSMELNKEVMFNFLKRSQGKGGLYNLERFEELVRLFSKDNNFEDVKPKLGFVATDIVTGEEVVLQVGDIAKAICASCALPFVFEPQVWGNKVLVDGGIVSIVPGNVAREAGMDIVIGVDLRSTRYVFSKWQIFSRKVLNQLRSILWPKQAESWWNHFSDKIKYSEFWQNYLYLGPYHEPEFEDPKIWSVITKSLDIAIASQEKHNQNENYNCDLLITKELKVPFLKRMLFVRFMHFDDMEEYYKAGRKAAIENLPRMWQLLKNHQNKLQVKDEQLNKLLVN